MGKAKKSFLVLLSGLLVVSVLLAAAVVPMGALTAVAAEQAVPEGLTEAATTTDGDTADTAGTADNGDTGSSNGTETIIIEDAETPLLDLDSGQASSSDSSWGIITLVFVVIAVLGWWFLVGKNRYRGEEDEQEA